MNENGRRIAALSRTVERRRRLDETLRATVIARREALSQSASRRDAQATRVDAQRALLEAQRARLARMTGGTAAISVPDMMASMRYIEVVVERLRGLEAELDALEGEVRAAAHALGEAQRAVATNRGRIDLCEARIVRLERDAEREAGDREDEEAEEAALARARLAMAGADRQAGLAER